MRRLGETGWGYIFQDDGTLRQSIDMSDLTVVVEKYFEGAWRTMSSYTVTKAMLKESDAYQKENKDNYFGN